MRDNDTYLFGEASVGVKLFPLLNKRLEVSRVAVDGLDVRLVSRGDEANNWKDLSDSEEKKEEAGGESQKATVAGIDITELNARLYG